MTTNIRDPRSIVTPDAFSVSEEMLGRPLATPGRRLAGMLIDLAVIGLLTAFVSGWGFFVWSLVGLVMLQLAFRSPGGSWTQGQLGRATVWAFRGSTGCLGFFILFIVLVSWWGSTFATSDVAEGLAESLGEAGVTVEQAVTENAGELTDDQRAGLEAIANLANAAAPDAPDTPEATPLQNVASELDVPGQIAARDEISGENAPDSVEVGGILVSTPLWDAALRTRAVELFAADTVATLEATNARRASAIGDLEAQLAEVREEADSGFFALARDILGQLGSAFGVWTLYFTVATVVLRGRTMGKLITGTRVVRLDGKPLTWLLSLERAGGYAAGLATGLMGFMQVYWDRNRQCVHDRIAGTVVIREGIAAVPGSWEEVWTAEEESGT